MRRAVSGENVAEEPAEIDGEEGSGAIQLSSDRYVEMSAQEQVVLTRVGQRLRQADLIVRVPNHRSRR